MRPSKPESEKAIRETVSFRADQLEHIKLLRKDGNLSPVMQRALDRHFKGLSNNEMLRVITDIEIRAGMGIDICNQVRPEEMSDLIKSDLERYIEIQSTAIKLSSLLTGVFKLYG